MQTFSDLKRLSGENLSLPFTITIKNSEATIELRINTIQEWRIFKEELDFKTT